MEGPRPARPEEFDQVMDLVNLVFLPDAAPTMQKDYPLVFNPDNTENLRIVLDDGKPVSNISLKQWPICVCGCVSKIGSIGSVCTHPDHRGKGYATKILQHCVDDLDVCGGSLMLISGSRGLYQRAHATQVGKTYTLLVSADDARKTSDPSFAVKPCDLSRIPDYTRLHQQEAVRFVREPDHWRKMLHVALNTEGRRTRLFHEIWRQDELVAYVVVMPPTRPYHKGLARLTEYAGSREAIVSALGKVLGQSVQEKIELRVPAHDVQMKVQVMKFGVDLAVSAMPGTWKMINLPRFAGTFWHYLEERLDVAVTNELGFSDEGGKYTIRYGDEKFVARDGTHLMQILFGKGDEPIPLDGVPKDIAEILKAVTPIPLPVAGMNSV